MRDFADVQTARAWHQALDEAGIEAVLTADWPLDRFGRGDIALRVPPEDWSEAELPSPTSTDDDVLDDQGSPRRVARWYGWPRGSSPYESRLTV